VIDLHCHLLPGIDDGPGTMEESLVMARAFVDAGTTRVAVTPHVSWDYPHVTPELITTGVRGLRDALDAAGVPLEIVPGAEIALSRAGDLEAETLRSLTLGDGPWLLVEPPFSPSIAGIEAVIDSLLLGGHRLLLAHPERSPSLAREPERLRPYVDAGMLCQITTSSLTGDFGRTVQKAARQMIDGGLAHVLASDAHNVTRRPPGLGAGAAVLHDPQLAAWLTTEVPEAIVAGRPIPERPARVTTRRDGLLARLRGHR
jgi:protein-tyrosine phosphatase